jgi:hypothetical protein
MDDRPTAILDSPNVHGQKSLMAVERESYEWMTKILSSVPRVEVAEWEIG